MSNTPKRTRVRFPKGFRSRLCRVSIVVALSSISILAVCVKADDSGMAAYIQRPLDSFNITVTRTARPPTIDGNLDDSAWALCHPYGGFTQFVPNQESRASENTVCYFTYDNENLYVAVQCQDSEPDKIVANLSRREDIGGDDLVQIMLDTYNDRRSCYTFILNPLGVQADEIKTINGSDNSWDGVWTSAGKITADGWQVEAAIPFKILRYSQSPEQVWRGQVFRLIQRKSEIDCYVPMRKIDNNDLERMAELRGISSIGGEHLLELTPYVTGKYDEFPDDAKDKHQGAVGLDAKYGLGSNLIVDATIHPDFGHVEADINYVNLSPYELYLQEKRPFFLEKMDIFETPFRLFYSRRITDPDGGVKLTGKVGKYGLGAFYANDNNDLMKHKDDFVIARCEREVMTQSHVGAMLTYVGKKERRNTTGSIDWRLIRGSFTLSGQVAKSDTKGYEGLDWKGSIQTAFARNNIKLTYSYAFYEMNFAADAGFVYPIVVDLMFTPFSYRTHMVKTGYSWYINRHSIQSISAMVDGYVQHDYNGTPLVRNLTPAVSIGFERNIGITLSSYFERRLWEHRYFDRHLYAISASVNPRGYLGAFVYYEEGQDLSYWDVASVWQKFFTFDVTWNPIQKLEIIPSVSHISQYEHQHGRRTYNQWNGSLRAGYQFTKDMFAKIFLQGNGYADFYTANVLFGYTFLAGSTLYLAYNSDYLEVKDKFNAVNRILFVKVSMLWSL